MSTALAEVLLPEEHPILQTRRVEEPITVMAPLDALVGTHRPMLVKMMAALAPFACTDTDRAGLNRVHLEAHDEKRLILMATDGHTAAMLAVEILEHGIPRGCMGLTIDSVKTFVSSKGFSPFVWTPEHEQFPWIRQVTQIAPEPYAGVFGVNAKYFGRNSTAMTKLGYGKSAALRIQCGEDALSPVTATAPELLMRTKVKDGPTATVKLLTLTMPMRLE